MDGSVVHMVADMYGATLSMSDARRESEGSSSAPETPSGWLSDDETNSPISYRRKTNKCGEVPRTSSNPFSQSASTFNVESSPIQ